MSEFQREGMWGSSRGRLRPAEAAVREALLVTPRLPSVSKLVYPINTLTQIRLVSSSKEWTVHNRHGRYVVHTQPDTHTCTQTHLYCTYTSTVKDILVVAHTPGPSLVVTVTMVCKAYIFSQPMAGLISYHTAEVSVAPPPPDRR